MGETGTKILPLQVFMTRQRGTTISAPPTAIYWNAGRESTDFQFQQAHPSTNSIIPTAPPLYEEVDHVIDNAYRFNNPSAPFKTSSSLAYLLANPSASSSQNSIVNAPLQLSGSNGPSLKNYRQVGGMAARFDLHTPKLRKTLELTLKKPYNPLLYTKRGCTDVFCCMLFTVFLVGWIAIAFLALMWGKPERIIHPTDSLGRICGFDRPGAYNLSKKPYLLFFDMTKCVSYTTILTGCNTPQICVEKCPTTYFSYLELQKPKEFLGHFRLQIMNKLICDDSIDKNQIVNFEELKILVKNGRCAAYTINSAAVLGRCIPQIFLNMGRNIEKQFQNNSSLDKLIMSMGNGGGLVPTDKQINESGQQIVKDIVNSRAIMQKIAADLHVSWWQISAMLGISAIASFFWTLIMPLLGGYMIWLSIFILLGLLAFGSGFSFYRFLELTTAGAINDYSFQPNIEVFFEMPTTWLFFAICSAILFIIVFLIFCFVYTRIRIAVALIEESSRALGNMLSTLFFPIFPFILHLIVLGLWGTITISLASSGEENCRRQSPTNPAANLANGEPCDCKLLGTLEDPNCRYVNLTRDSDRLLFLQAYNLFGCFWLTCFISALSDMTVAGAFASHYFAFRKPRDVPSFPVLRSLGRAIRYHLGTLAFGSLILSIVKFFKVILDYLYNKLKGVQNPVGQCIYRVLSCFFWCLEKILRFLTKNAYIMTAIYGKGFCQSARDSFSLLARNIIRVTVLNRTTAFLLFVGKASITTAMGVLSFYYFSGRWVIDGLPQITLYYHFVPIILVIIGTYFICDLFFEVYDMGVDTTFLCFLEDSETNNGTVEKPFYMSDGLKKILGKENKF